MRASVVRVSVPPDALELLLLQHPQELGLQHRAHVADLVQKERAAGRQLKAPRLAVAWRR